jgi:hypothetical protein
MLLTAVTIVDVAVPTGDTIAAPLLRNFITPKRTPVVLLRSVVTTRLAMVIFGVRFWHDVQNV